jgi:hypothetical protein
MNYCVRLDANKKGTARGTDAAICQDLKQRLMFWDHKKERKKKR